MRLQKQTKSNTTVMFNKRNQSLKFKYGKIAKYDLRIKDNP